LPARRRVCRARPRRPRRGAAGGGGRPAARWGGFPPPPRRIRTSAGGGVVLVRLRETGAAQFFPEPLHALFGQTVPLEDLVRRSELACVSEQVAEAASPSGRVAAVERFLLGRLGARRPDATVATAVEAILQSRGRVRIAALARALRLGQDALEKRFRAVVGGTPKQLASLLRLRWVVGALRPGVNLSQLSIEAGYADQSHFIRAFRAVAGEAPQRFLRSPNYC